MQPHAAPREKVSVRRSKNWLDQADIERNSASLEKLERDLRACRHIQLELQNSLEEERSKTRLARRENKATQAALEETCIELQRVKDDNQRLLEENVRLHKLLMARQENPSPPQPRPTKIAETSTARRETPPPQHNARQPPAVHPMEPVDVIISPKPLARRSSLDSMVPRSSPQQEAAKRGPELRATPEAARRSPEQLASKPASPLRSVHFDEGALAPPSPAVGAEPCGVGLRITEVPPFRVSGCVVAGPAHRSGRVRPGDVLVAVDGATVSGRAFADVRRMILGPAGSEVTVLFSRARGGGEAAASFQVSLVRAPDAGWATMSPNGTGGGGGGPVGPGPLPRSPASLNGDAAGAGGRPVSWPLSLLSF